jgi:uncharacterized protein
MNTEQTFAILTDWYTAMGGFDSATVLNTLAEDVVFILAPAYKEKVPYLDTWVGRDAFAEASRIRDETTKITGFALRDLVAQGNKAVGLIYTKSTCIATGKEFVLYVVHWLEVNDEGKITKCTAYFDPIPEINAFTPDA